MSKRYILKVFSDSGVPTNWELEDFQRKHKVNVNDVKRLYTSFKVGKRRKIKRLRVVRTSQVWCECCGPEVNIEGSVGGVPFRRGA